MPESDALALLRAEVERAGKMETVAERLGVSRTAVSLLLSGKYSADPARMYDRILDVLGGVTCPHLEADIPRSVCRGWHERQRPPAQRASDVSHWRACQTCPHNPATQEASA